MKNTFRKPWPLPVTAGLCVALLLLLLLIANLRFNSTPSLPQGLYRLAPDVPAKGDYVAFCLDGPYAELAAERGYVRPGSCPSGLRPLLKRLAGLPGDVVDLSTLSIRSEDRQGRPLASVLENGVIPAGMALVLADHPGSFDSRYFGLVRLDSLRKAAPVLLLNPKGE